MTASNFLACFNETESFEGAFVNNPHDPGGATEAGVTQATYTAWRRSMHLPPAPVRDSTIEERQDIYRMYYWNPVHGDELFKGLDLVMVDTAWGSGDREAVKLLQATLGIEQDGVFGQDTLVHVTGHQWPGQAEIFIRDLCNRRLRFFQSLSTWKYFGKGWTARLNGIEIKALKMNADLTPT